MAIVNNRFTSSTNFFDSHTPFQIPTGTFATNKLSDMVFIDYIVPDVPVKINQIFGAPTNFQFNIFIKNKTINISLDFEIIYEKYFNISSPTKFVISPTNQRVISVSVDNSYINTLSITPVNKTNFKVLVKNTSSNLAYVLLADEQLSRKSFNSEINVG
jgi:hypothetical protein